MHTVPISWWLLRVPLSPRERWNKISTRPISIFPPKPLDRIFLKGKRFFVSLTFGWNIENKVYVAESAWHIQFSMSVRKERQVPHCRVWFTATRTWESVFLCWSQRRLPIIGKQGLFLKSWEQDVMVANTMYLWGAEDSVLGAVAAL